MIMTNAEAFRYDFGIYATELWAMPEKQFLEWLNAPCDREKPRDIIVRCKNCRWFVFKENAKHNYAVGSCAIDGASKSKTHYCAWGESKDEDA